MVTVVKRAVRLSLILMGDMRLMAVAPSVARIRQKSTVLQLMQVAGLLRM